MDPHGPHDESPYAVSGFTQMLDAIARRLQKLEMPMAPMKWDSFSKQVCVSTNSGGVCTSALSKGKTAFPVAKSLPDPGKGKVS